MLSQLAKSETLPKSCRLREIHQTISSTVSQVRQPKQHNYGRESLHRLLEQTTRQRPNHTLPKEQILHHRLLHREENQQQCHRRLLLLHQEDHHQQKQPTHQELPQQCRRHHQQRRRPTTGILPLVPSLLYPKALPRPQRRRRTTEHPQLPLHLATTTGSIQPLLRIRPTEVPTQRPQ